MKFVTIISHGNYLVALDDNGKIWMMNTYTGGEWFKNHPEDSK